MLGWKSNDRIDFDFRDAHDLDNMSGRAQNEQYVKQNLRARMQQAKCVLVVVGDSTRYLYKYIRWEIELALSLGLPIVASYLNESRSMDRDLCPPLLRDKCVLHVPFKLAAIREALEIWPPEFQGLSAQDRSAGARVLTAQTYSKLGL